MAMYRPIRLDVMSGNRDNSQVKSAKYFKDDVVASVENSYTIDDETGEVHNKTPDEIMAELGFEE